MILDHAFDARNNYFAKIVHGGVRANLPHPPRVLFARLMRGGKSGKAAPVVRPAVGG